MLSHTDQHGPAARHDVYRLHPIHAAFDCESSQVGYVASTTMHQTPKQPEHTVAKHVIAITCSLSEALWCAVSPLWHWACRPHRFAYLLVIYCKRHCLGPACLHQSGKGCCCPSCCTHLRHITNHCTKVGCSPLTASSIGTLAWPYPAL